jgi:hypothetical protein
MSFIKAWVVRRLKPVLSPFLKTDSIDPDLIEFDARGRLVLSDLELNPALADSMDLPVELKAASVRRIEVQVGDGFL